MVQTMDTPPFDLQAYQPPISLWKLVEQYVPVHEREEIKNMLGESLIDQSMELHEEINTLLEIWRDYRDETTTVKPVSKLPEPPGLRGRLIQEIQFFVGSVKEKAKNEGVNSDKILSRHNTEVLDYAMDTFRAESVRPSSRQAALGIDGRETPMICSPTCSDRTSEASILSEEVEAMNEKLNILKFDEVVNHLRATLEEEVETLLKDISFLQNCLDDEATFRAESTGLLSREPTLTELREERSFLEKDLLASIKVQTSPELKKPGFTPLHTMKALGPRIPSAGKLKSIGNGDTKLSKPGPLRALAQDSKEGGASTPEPIRTQKERNESISSADAKFGNLSNSVSVRANSADKTRANPNNAPRQITSNSELRPVKKSISESASSVPQSRSGVIPKRHGDSDIKSKDRLKDTRQPTLEALVTLTKGKTGDAADVRMIPSPPTSAKPTSSRPSSAQRFRSMVLDCRDTK